MIGSTKVEEQAREFLHSKQNFCFGDALHYEDVRILHSDPFYHRNRTAIVHFFGAVGLSASLSLLVVSFESPTVSLDVSGLFAVVAHAIVAGFPSTP